MLRASTCFVRVWICGGGERPFPFSFFPRGNAQGGGGGRREAERAAERAGHGGVLSEDARAEHGGPGAGTVTAQISDESSAQGPGGHCRSVGDGKEAGDAAHARGGAYGRRGQWR